MTPFTLFAPSNAAFAKIQGTVDSLLLPQNQSKLSQVIRYHIVPGLYMSSDLKAGGTLYTMDGEALAVDDVLSSVLVVDIEATNGVVHVIERVLLPASLRPSDAVVATAAPKDDAKAKDIAAHLVDMPELSELLAAATAAGAVNLLRGAQHDNYLLP